MTAYAVPSGVMDVLQAVLLLLAGAGATAVVLTRSPERQAVVLSAYGLVLALLFLAFQAPDVSLSELAVGTVALPALLLLTLDRIRRREK